MAFDPSRIPGLEPLTRDYMIAFDRVAALYGGDPHDLTAYDRVAARVDARCLPRAEVATVLTEKNRAFRCDPRALASIDALSAPGTRAVVTGHQPILFGGPLFVMLKALTTIKLAQTLNALGRGVHVPVFYIASDDHDHREAGTLSLRGADGERRTLTHRGTGGDDRVPLSHVQLGEEIEALRQMLLDALPDGPGRALTTARLEAAWRIDHTFSRAFGTWMSGLFSPHGLVMLDPADPRLKALCVDAATKEITHRSPSTRRVRETTTRLADLGYVPQIKLRANRLNLFLLEDGSRNALEARDDGFVATPGQREISQHDLLETCVRAPERFSPNVVLRPIMQDLLLPTVASVQGPAEIAYHAQLGGVYADFDLPMPIIVPRKSVTLLEARDARTLEALGLSVCDLWRDRETLVRSVLHQRLPQALHQKLDDARAALAQGLEAYRALARSVDPDLERTAASTQARLMPQIAHLERKITDAASAREENLSRKLRRACGEVFPEGVLQDRFTPIASILAAHGDAIVETLLTRIDPLRFEHSVIPI